jgi:hypothetical protein
MTAYMFILDIRMILREAGDGLRRMRIEVENGEGRSEEGRSEELRTRSGGLMWQIAVMRVS